MARVENTVSYEVIRKTRKQKKIGRPPMYTQWITEEGLTAS